MMVILGEYVLPFIGSLLLVAVVTLIAEAPFYLAASAGAKCSLGYKLGIFILINIITNMTIMVIWLAITYIIDDSFEVWLMILLGVLQITAALIEAFVYRKALKTEKVKTLVCSFLANALSAAAVMFVIFQFEL